MTNEDEPAIDGIRIAAITEHLLRRLNAMGDPEHLADLFGRIDWAEARTLDGRIAWRSVIDIYDDDGVEVGVDLVALAEPDGMHVFELRELQ